jgi:hypothetical protein
VSATTNVEANNALSSIVIINQAVTLVLLLDSAGHLVTARSDRGATPSQSVTPSAPTFTPGE